MQSSIPSVHIPTRIIRASEREQECYISRVIFRLCQRSGHICQPTTNSYKRTLHSEHNSTDFLVVLNLKFVPLSSIAAAYPMKDLGVMLPFSAFVFATSLNRSW